MNEPYMATVMPDVLPDNPLAWAQAWLRHATANAVQRNPNAMTLATVGGNGAPTARVVLCKEFVTQPGFVVFYTNYRSKKVAQLAANPQVALTFHWDALEGALGRQVRLEGIAVRSPAAESDAYFATRDWGSRVGAWGSDQSAVLESRAALFRQVRERAAALGIELSENLQSIEDGSRPDIPRPPHWGGIRVWPQRVELWIEGVDRIHDRAAWTRSMEPADEHTFIPGPWTGTRLQP